MLELIGSDKLSEFRNRDVILFYFFVFQNAILKQMSFILKGRLIELNIVRLEIRECVLLVEEGGLSVIDV